MRPAVHRDVVGRGGRTDRVRNLRLGSDWIMKRWIITFVLAVLCAEMAAPAFAARVRVFRGRRGHTRVVVHRGFPLHRTLPVVVVRPARVTVRVAPVVFLAPVVWTAAVITTAPAHHALVWEDAETLTKDEEWTEFTLDCDQRGTKLYLEIAAGKAQLNFAEVVFENGDTQVVDFDEKTHGPGLYSLLDFKDGRKVDHVRMVARAKSDQARVVLRLS